MGKITIFIPDGPKSAWSKAQLAATGARLNGLASLHLDAIKEEIRARIGPEGGKVPYGTSSFVTVNKMGEPKETTDWKAVALEALARLDGKEADAIRARHTCVKPAGAQGVRFN